MFWANKHPTNGHGIEGWHFYSGVLVPQNHDTYLFCLALVGWRANSGNPPDHMWTYVGSPNMGHLICFFFRIVACSGGGDRYKVLI